MCLLLKSMRNNRRTTGTGGATPATRTTIATATVTRTTVTPKDTTALTDDDFGFSETFEFFPHGETHDPVAGTDT